MIATSANATTAEQKQYALNELWNSREPSLSGSFAEMVEEFDAMQIITTNRIQETSTMRPTEILSNALSWKADLRDPRHGLGELLTPSQKGKLTRFCKKWAKRNEHWGHYIAYYDTTPVRQQFCKSLHGIN
jgi:hypothetical protein